MGARFRLFLLFTLAGLPGQAAGHSFFSQACCGTQDCKPAPTGAVKWTPKGWMAQGEMISFADPRIQYNPPQEPGIFICRIPGQPKVRCLYLPQPEI